MTAFILAEVGTLGRDPNFSDEKQLNSQVPCVAVCGYDQGLGEAWRFLS
jgi:hypothetical protein